MKWEGGCVGELGGDSGALLRESGRYPGQVLGVFKHLDYSHRNVSKEMPVCVIKPGRTC